MSMEVEGDPRPTVTFYKDDQKIVSNNMVKVHEEGNTYSLEFVCAQFRNSGLYTIVALNDISQTTEHFRLNVQARPSILKDLGKNVECQPGEHVTLTVKLEAEPAPDIRWLKDGHPIKSDQHYQLSNVHDNYTLLINNASVSDSAVYEFRASNEHGEAACSVRLDCHTPPKVLSSFADLTVTERQRDVTLDVHVEAYPRPTVRWFLDETEITESRTEYLRVEEEYSVRLVLKEVVSTMKGVYRCELSNEHGETSVQGRLTVQCEPHLVRRLTDATVDEGGRLELAVEVDASPEPEVRWRHNGRDVSADARIKITRDSHRNETYCLTADLVRSEDGGEYEVIVTNSMGTVTCKSTVNVQSKYV